MSPSMFACMHVGKEEWDVCVHPANLNSKDGQLFWCSACLESQKKKS